MKIENQVCTLEQAKRLKELGVEQKSYFYWWFHFSHDRGYVYSLGLDDEDDKVNSKNSAFTVAELGCMLPNAFDTIRFTNPDDIKICGWKAYNSSDEPMFGYDKYFDTEAEARAAMLIYLLEKNLITAEEINQRLLNFHKT